MPWSRSAEYAPLPTSTSPSSPLDAPRLGFPIESQSRSRSRRAYYALGACCALLLLSSVFVVPEEALPVRVSSAVGASREAFEAAKSSWGWQTQEELDAEITQLDVEEAIERVGGEVSEASTGEEAGGMDATKAEPDLLSVEEDIACPEEVKKQVGEPEFWTVRASTTALNDTTYAIVPRSPFPTDLSRACLSQAVFSARLVAFDDALLRSPERETLYALPRPTLSRGFDSYDIHLDREAAIPLKRYELEVTLEFGYFPGSTRGICGSDKVCQERILSDELGGQLDYVGGKINVEEDVGAVPAGTLIDPQDTVPLCDSLSSIRGYWSSLSYHPFQPAPCSLFDPNFPLPFAPPATKEQDNAPLWIHFVGDSNTRNMFSQFLISLGNGHKINAPQVIDSKTHNGTHASFASRWRSGEIPSEGDGSVPDVIVTWSWWYESTPSSRSQENGEVLWNANLRDNRDDLLRLADTNLADYLEYANLGAATRGNPSLSNLAVTLRPQRTYLSLGSHSERLSVPGAVSSLDYLLDETTGLSRAKRDAANLRVFTTTNVNPSYIPLDRFPHQDLVRNNAFISAKNSLTRSRPEFTEAASSTRRGGRVIDVEALTNGITVGADWMKPGKKGRSPDAVHFREEVYDEWVRLVWTDLVQGIDVSTTARVPERRRWKKSRIEDWDDEDEF